MQSIPALILGLAELTGVDREQLVHFVTGRNGAGDIKIDVPRGRCIVIVQIQQTDVDPSFTRSIQVVDAGVTQAAVRDLELVGEGIEVMYFFSTAKLVFTLALVPAAGKVAHTLFSYFEMPDAAAAVLKNSATRQLIQA